MMLHGGSSPELLLDQLPLDAPRKLALSSLCAVDV